MPRFAVHRLDEIPTVPDADVDWHPLQHYFGIETFGANLFIARDAGDELIAAHDAEAISVAAVPEPFVRRAATALEPGSTMLALGAPPGSYRSTWRSSWFEHVPTAR